MPVLVFIVARFLGLKTQLGAYSFQIKPPAFKVVLTFIFPDSSG